MFEPMKHPMTVMSAMNFEPNHPMRRPPPPAQTRPEPPAAKQETAWERGLRQAKEVIFQVQNVCRLLFFHLDFVDDEASPATKGNRYRLRGEKNELELRRRRYLQRKCFEH